jgi:hypothetical protein
MRTTRKRRTAFAQVGTTNPSVDELAQPLHGQAGLFLLRYEHDDGCETLSSQRMDDCMCAAVDHRLLRFVDGGTTRE